MNATTRPVSGRRLAASYSRTAEEICANIKALSAQRGPEFAAELLGGHWRVLSGRRVAERTLHGLVTQIAKGARGDRERATSIFRVHFMDADEQVAFDRLARAESRLILYRFTNFTRFTGWYLNRDDARAEWLSSTAPLAVDTMAVRAFHVLATKESGSRVEIVLRSDFRPTPNREVLS